MTAFKLNPELYSIHGVWESVSKEFWQSFYKSKGHSGTMLKLPPNSADGLVSQNL